MFSRLDSIFRTNFRETEAVDTRQAIRRKEEDGQSRSDHQKKDQAGDLFGEDQAQVSVPALIAFLESLLAGSQASQKPSEPTPESASPAQKSAEDSELEKSPVARAATVAASAYEKTARRTEEATVQNAPENTENIILKPEEQKAIASLIRELKALEQKNVDDLTLPPGASFLDSLQKAVRQAG